MKLPDLERGWLTERRQDAKTHRVRHSVNHFQHMRYLGEYLIPIAAIVLVFVVALRDEIVFGERLVKRLIERMRERR